MVLGLVYFLDLKGGSLLIIKFTNWGVLDFIGLLQTFIWTELGFWKGGIFSRKPWKTGRVLDLGS